MIAWITVFSAISQIILLLLQAHYSKETEVKQSKVDKAKGISDAIVSGNISIINASIMGLRR